MNNEEIASTVSMTSRFLNGLFEGYGAPVPDRFVTRAALISSLAFDIGKDETPEIAIRMLGQQVTVYLEECDPATRHRLLTMIANDAAKSMGMDKGDKACE